MEGSKIENIYLYYYNCDILCNVDTDPVGSAFILCPWIRIRIPTGSSGMKMKEKGKAEVKKKFLKGLGTDLKKQILDFKDGLKSNWRFY